MSSHEQARNRITPLRDDALDARTIETIPFRLVGRDHPSVLGVCEEIIMDKAYFEKLKQHRREQDEK